MIILYLAIAAAWLFFWLKGQLWAAAFICLLLLAFIFTMHSSYVFDSNAPHRAYLALQGMCPSGAIMPCDYVKTVKGSLMQTLSFDGKDPAPDNSLPVFTLIAVAGTLLAFTPYIIHRRRAARMDRALNGLRLTDVD
ncbi:hypothetical protein [Neokomagataea anthophila]|uniref:Uncharacterized protein n=1 Tax=Neokomagataea anthophila TaxID=2826925 RepID=A0ABS5E818_9PROT|nr:hypothetical protein [Neokomagataea anthophila]MBR0560045.1 hypothetical protein [Neokomagataea anthophila]